MKPAKIMLGILLSLLFAIWIAGLIGGETEYSVSVEVNTTSENAWKVFTNDSLFSYWLMGFKSIQRIAGTSLTQGSEYRLTFEEADQEYEMIQTLTAIEENRLFAFDGVTDIMDYHTEISFALSDSMTIITDHSVYKGKGFMLKAFIPLMHDMLVARAKQMYQKLAVLMENPDVQSAVDSVKTSTP